MTAISPRVSEDEPERPEDILARREAEREEERKLVQRAIARDANAFAELYDRLVVRVYRHIYYLVATASS